MNLHLNFIIAANFSIFCDYHQLQNSLVCFIALGSKVMAAHFKRLHSVQSAPPTYTSVFDRTPKRAHRNFALKACLTHIIFNHEIQK